MTINWLLILLIYIIKQDNVKPFISFDIPVFYEILQAVYNFIQEKMPQVTLLCKAMLVKIIHA